MHVNIPAPGILWVKRVRIFSQLKPQLKERLSRKRPKILCHKNTCLAILCLWPFFGDRWKSRDPLTHSVAVNVTNPMFSGGWKSQVNEIRTGCLGYMSGMKSYPVVWGSFHKPWNKRIPSLTNQDDSMESILVAFIFFVAHCMESPGASFLCLLQSQPVRPDTIKRIWLFLEGSESVNQVTHTKRWLWIGASWSWGQGLVFFW